MSFVPSWQFKSDDVLGYIAGGGEHGVQIALTADGKPGTRPMCLNVEHYYSRSCRDGFFVPRYKARVHSELTAEDSVGIHIEPYGDWRVETTVQFKLLPGPVIEARYEFRFQAAFRGFEAFISNYFYDPTEPFLHLNGGWRQPKLSDHEHRFWARGAREAENIKAVYASDTRPGSQVELPLDETYFDHPVMITPLANSKQSIVNIVETEHCSSLSANRVWNAHDFSLIARDVAEGERVVCRAWLCCTQLESPEDAIRLARKLCAPAAP